MSLRMKHKICVLITKTDNLSTVVPIKHWLFYYRCIYTERTWPKSMNMLICLAYPMNIYQMTMKDQVRDPPNRSLVKNYFNLWLAVYAACVMCYLHFFIKLSYDVASGSEIASCK